ncbi:hypothetical protein SNE40_002565 [Patella caerulea]|uniref:Vertnin n=1 Tax=Patella caerulea TaxID=87958 RepID=A0AAN8PZB7_PATCE
MDTGIQIDEIALDYCPHDTYGPSILYPVKVLGDGNYLPYSGSVLAFGHPNRVTEMRVRIIVEQTVHEDYYLKEENLTKGLQHNGEDLKLKTSFAMYSDQYVGGALGDEAIQEVYQKEIMNITRDRSEMGIWQVVAMATVLKRPLYSVHPKLGNANVRKHLHRLIVPRIVEFHCPVNVLWTTTRNDMIPRNRQPNHFVPLLPIEEGRGVVIQSEASCRVDKENEAEIEETEPEKVGEGTSAVDKEHEAELDVTETEKMEETLFSNENELDNNKVNFKTKTYQMKELKKENMSKKEEIENPVNLAENQGRLSENAFFEESLETLLGKYVIVLYAGLPFPGLVVDTEVEQVFVHCMHRAGRNINAYSFFWPKMVDVDWYGF